MARTTTKKAPKKPQNSVIYGLYDEDRLLYIGSTSNAEKRYNEHLKALQEEKHSNKTLLKYCTNNLVTPRMEILHICKDDSRLRKFIAEMIMIDYNRPPCNRPILQFGRYTTNMGFVKEPFDIEIMKYL